MRIALRWWIGLLLALVFLTQVWAQGQLVIVDPARRLNQPAIRAAADPLLRRGAQVAVYVVDSGGEADFERRLIADGLASSGGAARSTLIAIYVAVNDSYSVIRFGDEWSDALAVNDNYELIRTDKLNPGLSDGDFTRGVTSALTAIEAAIVNPPRPGGGITINTDLTPVVIGGLGLAGAAAAGVGAYQLHRRQKTRRAAERRLRDSRERIGTLIVQLGQRFNSSLEKAKFDRISYPPVAVAELEQMQEVARKAFADLKVTFDEIGEQLDREAKPSVQQVEIAATAYERLQAKAAEVASHLDALEQRRAHYEALMRQAQEDVSRAKKVLTDVSERLPQFGKELTDHAAVLRPIQSVLHRAEAALERLEATEAIQAAQEASVIGQTLMDILDRYATVRAAIPQGRRTAEALAAEGYRMEACHGALDEARAALDRLADTLQQGTIPAATTAIAEAEAALARAQREGFDLPTIRADNERRIAALAARGPQTAKLIATGREAFDLVDEFAESTWADIRGNGSEAEAALARAFEHWEQARTANTMEVQEFLAARSYLDAAEQELDHAARLITAITDRLRALEEARSIAREIMAEAERSINSGLSFVAAHDPDVSPQADALLRQAAALLATAKAEAAKAKPDWLQLVRAAQEADRLADEALAGARDEVEQTNRLRERAQQIKQLATNEVQKLVHYVAVHDADLSPAVRQQLDQVRTMLQQAYALFQQAEIYEDEARRQALTAAMNQYQSLAEAATTTYQQAYAEVQRLETLRAELNQVLQRVREKLNRITQLQHTSPMGVSSAVAGQITALQQRFHQIRLPINGEEALRTALREAQEIDAGTDNVLKTLQPPVISPQATDTIVSTLVRLGNMTGGWGHSHSWSTSSHSSEWSSSGGGGGSFGGGGGGGSFGGGGGGGGW